MSGRPRHQRKEGEAVLQDAEDHECRVTKGKKYFKIKCACGAHMTTLHLTPRSDGHFTAKHAKMRKWPCWNQEVLQ